MLKTTKAPVRLQIDDKEVIYVCFWTKNYSQGQVLTVRSNPGEGPVRCQLLSLHKEIKHPINEYGQELTEQWWDFRYIPEKEYHRHAQLKRISSEQPPLF